MKTFPGSLRRRSFHEDDFLQKPLSLERRRSISSSQSGKKSRERSRRRGSTQRLDDQDFNLIGINKENNDNSSSCESIFGSSRNLNQSNSGRNSRSISTSRSGKKKREKSRKRGGSQKLDDHDSNLIGLNVENIENSSSCESILGSSHSSARNSRRRKELFIYY